MRSVRELMDLSGRVALVTGGVGHIGFAVADALAELGAAVVIVDREQTRCDECALELQARQGCSTLALGVDLACEEAVRHLPGRVARVLGRLDVLVNCAAFVGTSQAEGWNVPFEQQAASTWRQALEVNLTSVFCLTQSAAPLLRASTHGSVINVASIYGVYGPDMKLYEGTGMNNPAAYAASKGGLIQFTRWCATVLAPDIRVNAVSPGGLYRGQHEDFVTRYVSKTPLRRMAVEEDLKGVVCFLASDLSAYVTGQNIIIDGGLGVL